MKKSSIAQASAKRSSSSEQHPSGKKIKVDKQTSSATISDIGIPSVEDIPLSEDSMKPVEAAVIESSFSSANLSTPHQLADVVTGTTETTATEETSATDTLSIPLQSDGFNTGTTEIHGSNSPAAENSHVATAEMPRDAVDVTPQKCGGNGDADKQPATPLCIHSMDDINNNDDVDDVEALKIASDVSNVTRQKAGTIRLSDLFKIRAFGRVYRPVTEERYAAIENAFNDKGERMFGSNFVMLICDGDDVDIDGIPTEGILLEGNGRYFFLRLNKKLRKDLPLTVPLLRIYVAPELYEKLALAERFLSLWYPRSKYAHVKTVTAKTISGKLVDCGKIEQDIRWLILTWFGGAETWTVCKQIYTRGYKLPWTEHVLEKTMEYSQQKDGEVAKVLRHALEAKNFKSSYLMKALGPIGKRIDEEFAAAGKTEKSSRSEAQSISRAIRRRMLKEELLGGIPYEKLPFHDKDHTNWEKTVVVCSSSSASDTSSKEKLEEVIARGARCFIIADAGNCVDPNHLGMLQISSKTNGLYQFKAGSVARQRITITVAAKMFLESEDVHPTLEETIFSLHAKSNLEIVELYVVPAEPVKKSKA